MQWQVQDAKQRFSELLRRAHEDGPQIVTRHGAEVAVVVDIREYRRLKGEELSFKEFLLRPTTVSSDGPAAADEYADLVDAVVADRGDDRGRDDATALFGDE